MYIVVLVFLTHVFEFSALRDSRGIARSFQLNRKSYINFAFRGERISLYKWSIIGFRVLSETFVSSSMHFRRTNSSKTTDRVFREFEIIAGSSFVHSPGFARNCLRDAGKRTLVSRSGARRCRGIKAAHGIFKGKGATFVDVRANRVIRRNHPPPPAVTALLQKGVCKRALCRRHRRRRRRFQWGQRKTRPLQSLWGRTVTTDP